LDGEIKAIIEDELTCLLHENERLWLMQEHLARRKVMAKRTQVMQQQIEQEGAAQIELQRAIEHLHRQEHELSVQESPATAAPATATSSAKHILRQNNINSKCPLANNM
jgi:phage gp37-like protein